MSQHVRVESDGRTSQLRCSRGAEKWVQGFIHSFNGYSSFLVNVRVISGRSS